jgi:hypothetical protein
MMTTTESRRTHEGTNRQQRPVQKQGCLEALPVVLFQIIQEYSTETNYRNLMNANLSTFQCIKRETVRYSLLDRPKKWAQFHPYQELIFTLIIKSVKDKSKQISMAFSDVQHSTALKYAHLFKAISKLSLSYSRAADQRLSCFRFNMFDNIYHLVLQNIHGIPVLRSAPKNIVKLELIHCGFTRIEEPNPSKSLSSFKISLNNDLDILGSLDAVRQVDIFYDMDF